MIVCDVSRRRSKKTPDRIFDNLFFDIHIDLGNDIDWMNCSFQSVCVCAFNVYSL